MLACAGAGGEKSSTAGPTVADSLYIGVAAALTPAASAYFEGVALAVEHLNQRRPAQARPFAVRRPRAEQAAQVAVAAAFRDDPSVIGVVGHTGSAQTLEAAPIYGDVEGGGRRGVVAISPTATNPRATRTSEWVFRVCPTDADGAATLARFAADSLGARHVAVIYRNDLFGRGFVRTFAESFTAAVPRATVTTGARATRGGLPSPDSSGPSWGAPRNARGAGVDRYPYLAGITEYEAYAAEIARRAPTVVVIAGGAADAADVVRAVRKAGGAPAFLGSDDVAALASGEQAADFRGLRYIAFFLPDRATSGTAAGFVRAYRARFGREPDHRAALSYDAAMLIGRAALAVGGDRRRIRDWVARVGRDGAPHLGVTGKIRFDEWGDPEGKPVLLGEVRS